MSLPLPIRQAARKLAQQFANQQPDPQKAEQVYLNTLSACVVDQYLQLVGIATDLAASDSWNPVIRLCSDVADLKVTGIGRLECRPIRAHQQTCYVPPEVWEDRIGYVVVQIDQSMREAVLLGFTQAVATEELPLSQLQPLEGLLEHLSQLKQPVTASPAQSGKTLVNLSQWLKNLSETGWQTVEALLGTKPTLALSFRSADNFGEVDLNRSETGVRLGKLINLRRHPTGYPVALVVELRPETNLKTSICLQVHPTEQQTLLPSALQLTVLDESAAIFLTARSRNADNYIQLQFNGEPGERFSVKVALGDHSITEDFVV